MLAVALVLAGSFSSSCPLTLSVLTYVVPAFWLGAVSLTVKVTVAP